MIDESRADEATREPPSDPLGVTSALRGGSRLLALRSSQYAFFFVGGVIVARVLGPDLRAQYALALALGLVIWALVNLSLDTAAGRLLGRREATLVEVSRALATATLVLGLIGAAAAFAVGLAIRDALLSGASTTAVGLAALMVPSALSVQLLTGLLVRVGALRAYGWACAGCAALVLIADVVLSLTGSLTPESSIGAIVGGGVLLAVVLAVALSRYTGLRGLVPGGPRHIVLLLLKAGAVLHPAWLVLFLNLRLDLFLVSALADTRAAGLYSLSATLAEIIFLASLTIMHSAAQTQTEAEPDVAARYTLEFLRQILVFVLLAAGLAALAAYPAIELIYGREWRGSILPFVVLSFGAVAFSLEAPVRTLLARLARPSAILMPAFVGTVLNLGLNVVLIPTAGITGAALASLISYWGYTLLLLRRFGQVTGLPPRSVFARPTRDDLVVRLMHAGAARLPGARRRAR